jgi:lysozyme family protein
MNDTTTNNPFALAVQSILLRERGYVNNPNDPGGETKYGISKRWHPGLDIAKITPETAAQIYLAEYWQPLHFADLTYPAIQIHLFHVAVLNGPGPMIDLARKVLTLIWTPPRGRRQKTLAGDIAAKLNGAAAAHRAHASEVINFVWLALIAEVLRRNPSTACFADGWHARIDSVYQEVCDLWKLT